MSSPSGSNQHSTAALGVVQEHTESNLTSPLELAPIFKYCTPAEWRGLRRGPVATPPLWPRTFPFARLPAELRNQVYGELLITDVPIQLVHDRASWPDTSIPGKQLYPAILRACRNAFNEAAAILYGENTFYLHIENTVQQYECDMQRLDPSFTLPAPITSHMSQIKRIAMHFGIQDHPIRDYELYHKLLNVGIQMDSLQIFAIQFPDEEEVETNLQPNRKWLEAVQVDEIKTRCVWFPEGAMSEEGWVATKKGWQDGGGGAEEDDGEDEGATATATEMT